MQIVLNNNRVVAQDGNYITMGGVVIDTDTGIKYENATVAECDCYPTDIGKTSYEYRNGAFYPCAGISVLWENDGSVTSLASGSTLQLRHGNYDFAIVICSTAENATKGELQIIIPNGCTGSIIATGDYRRGFTFNNDVLTTTLGGGSAANSIPHTIYGVKI